MKIGLGPGTLSLLINGPLKKGNYRRPFGIRKAGIPTSMETMESCRSTDTVCNRRPLWNNEGIINPKVSGRHSFVRTTIIIRSQLSLDRLALRNWSRLKSGIISRENYALVRFKLSVPRQNCGEKIWLAVASWMDGRGRRCYQRWKYDLLVPKPTYFLILHYYSTFFSLRLH